LAPGRPVVDRADAIAGLPAEVYFIVPAARCPPPRPPPRPSIHRRQPITHRGFDSCARRPPRAASRVASSTKLGQTRRFFFYAYYAAASGARRQVSSYRRRPRVKPAGDFFRGSSAAGVFSELSGAAISSERGRDPGCPTPGQKKVSPACRPALHPAGSPEWLAPRGRGPGHPPTPAHARGTPSARPEMIQAQTMPRFEGGRGSSLVDIFFRAAPRAGCTKLGWMRP